MVFPADEAPASIPAPACAPYSEAMRRAWSAAPPDRRANAMSMWPTDVFVFAAVPIDETIDGHIDRPIAIRAILERGRWLPKQESLATAVWHRVMRVDVLVHP